VGTLADRRNGTGILNQSPDTEYCPGGFQVLLRAMGLLAAVVLSAAAVQAQETPTRKVDVSACSAQR